METKLTKKQIKEIAKKLKGAKIKTQETEACEHKELRKIAKESLWFQCKQCKNIFFIFGCVLYNKKLLEKDIKEIIENAED